MRKLLLLAVFAVAAVIAFKVWDKQHALNAAHERAEIMVRALAQKDEQLALARWAALEIQGMDPNTVAAYYDRFQKFEADTGIALGTDWRVVDAAPDPAGFGVQVTLVSGEQRIRLRVPPRAEMTVVSTE